MKSGQIWQSPMDLLAVVQDLGGDRWALLTTPMLDFADSGAVSMRALPSPFGDTIVTRAQLEAWLSCQRWVRREDLSLSWQCCI